MSRRRGPVETSDSRGRRAFLRDLGVSLAASVAAPAVVRAQGSTPRAKPRKGGRRQAAPPARTRAGTAPPVSATPVRVAQGGWPRPEPGQLVDLSPARWIWLPSARTLANTVVLLRREVVLARAPREARGWIAADSRYRLWVNGRRVQWGPAPCDPRAGDADPIDLTAHLEPGPNVIAAEVLFYGVGEGTWPTGKPGLLFALRILDEGGTVQEVLSDESWRVLLDRGHRPGQFKRWYLRTLQEDFDARLRPEGWNTRGFRPDGAWLAPLVLDAPADRPAASSSYYEYLGDGGIARASAELRAREVPLLREEALPVQRLVRSGRVRWTRDPDDWFQYRMPGSFDLMDDTSAEPTGEGGWTLRPAAGEGAHLLFELPEQMVGFPFVTVEAPAGTIVEMMTQEAHDPAAPAWLDTHHFSWARFVCREGANRFETLDYESLRFLQLHVRGATGPVLLRDVGVRRRSYAWPRPPGFRCAEPPLQRLFEAAFNTLVNAAQETIVDGMGRERQQYSGDGAHVLHATRLVCGDVRLARRFLRTFALGQTVDGYFLDCWPAYDRLNRIAQRQVGATPWGPLLDHGLTFIYDAWRHHLETGETELPAQLYPRLARFASFLLDRRGTDGLLPVEGWGVPAVWMDNEPCFPRQRHKQCAFNLFTAAVLREALAPLARLTGDTAAAARHTAAAAALLAATVRRFWSAERGLFVANLPWLREEGGPRLDDRSLATALIFDQYPAGRTGEAIAALAEPPTSLGLSYPANAHWRLQALARHGRIDVVLRELRHRWAPMPSVTLNNTIAEQWEVRPDSTDQWSHCAVSPLFLLFMDVAGLRPAAPGFERVRVRPQLGDLPALELTAHTVRGPIGFRSEPVQEGGHQVWITLPPETPGELLLPAGTGRGVPVTAEDRALRLERYALPPGQTTEFDVPPVRRRPARS